MSSGKTFMDKRFLHEFLRFTTKIVRAFIAQEAFHALSSTYRDPSPSSTW
jgi:hypothetical protein